MKFISSVALLCTLNFSPRLDLIAGFVGSESARALACVSSSLAEQMRPVMKFADEHTDPVVLAFQTLKGEFITSDRCYTHRALAFKLNGHEYRVVAENTGSENMSFGEILALSIRNEFSIDLELSEAPVYDGLRIFGFEERNYKPSDIFRGLEVLRTEFKNNLAELQVKVGDNTHTKIEKSHKIQVLIIQILPGIKVNSCVMVKNLAL